MPDVPDLFPGTDTKADGTLRYRVYRGPHNYIDWDPHKTRITLDGLYTVDDLRRIIEHMERFGAAS